LCGRSIAASLGRAPGRLAGRGGLRPRVARVRTTRGSIPEKPRRGVGIKPGVQVLPEPWAAPHQWVMTVFRPSPAGGQEMDNRDALWSAGRVLTGVRLLTAAAHPPKGKDPGPILYVGVRSLPEFLSPATAWTDAERQAVELLFESLVTVGTDPSLGER